MIHHARGQIRSSSEEDLRTVANAITLLRIIISLLLFCAAAYQRNPMLNLAGLAVYWVGDVADGFLARKLNQETLFGAQWDILGDRIWWRSSTSTAYGCIPRCCLPLRCSWSSSW